MTKNEKEFIVSTIAGKPREVSGEAFMELNRLLYETSIDKTCENCKYEDCVTCPVYDYESGLTPQIVDFGCNKFNEREQDAD